MASLSCDLNGRYYLSGIFHLLDKRNFRVNTAYHIGFPGGRQRIRDCPILFENLEMLFGHPEAPRTRRPAGDAERPLINSAPGTA